MNHAPLRILTGAAALVLSVSLLTGAAVPVRSLPAASGEETVLARPSLQDPDTLARAVACQSLSYYRPELLDRYLAYGALWPELSPEDVVTRVNIGLDGTFYGDVSQAEEPESLSVLVNKYHPLPDGYVPQLHSLPARYAPSGGSLAPAAAAAFMRMADAAREDGITLYSVSAYRSYSYQDSLYRRYTAQDGVEADTYSARPGFSEHQTGLALDINTASRSAHFETTATYRWLIENCWRYGFILRYPEGREDITGFCFEPWHYRFVGRTLALQVRESGLTYDEFLARRAVDRPHTALCAGDMPLEAVPILLDGICWLPAQAVAAAFGRTAAISGDQLVLPAEEGSVVLTAGSLTGERDDRPFALSSLPFQWEGEFYLSLEDLCALLELTARREEGLISLIPRSAPSALLPEELPPIHSPADPARRLSRRRVLLYSMMWLQILQKRRQIHVSTHAAAPPAALSGGLRRHPVPGDLRRPGRGRRRRLPLCGPPQLCVSGGNAVLPLCQGRAQAGRPASVQQGVLLRHRSGSGGPPGVHHLLSQRHRLRPDPYFGGRGGETSCHLAPGGEILPRRQPGASPGGHSPGGRRTVPCVALHRAHDRQAGHRAGSGRPPAG